MFNNQFLFILYGNDLDIQRISIIKLSINFYLTFFNYLFLTIIIRLDIKQQIIMLLFFFLISFVTEVI